MATKTERSRKKVLLRLRMVPEDYDRLKKLQQIVGAASLEALFGMAVSAYADAVVEALQKMKAEGDKEVAEAMKVVDEVMGQAASVQTTPSRIILPGRG